MNDATFARDTLAQIWDEMPVLLIGSLAVAASAAPPALLLLFSGYIPIAVGTAIFTVVPAWAAYCYLVGRNAVRFKPHPGDFVAAFVHYYRRSCLLGLPVAVFLLMTLTTSPFLTATTSVVVVAGITLQIVALVFACLLTLYAVPMLSLFDLSLRQAWSYSFVLVVRWPIVAAGLLGMAILLVFAVRTFGLGGWLVLPLIFVPFQVNATLMLTKRVLDAERHRN